MNLSKEHFDIYNEYTLNINKIKREVNAIIKRQKLMARRCKKASNEEMMELEINKRKYLARFMNFLMEIYIQEK